MTVEKVISNCRIIRLPPAREIDEWLSYIQNTKKRRYAQDEKEQRATRTRISKIEPANDPFGYSHHLDPILAFTDVDMMATKATPHQQLAGRR